MTKKELRNEIGPSLEALKTNIIDAENALCHVLAVADHAERLLKHGRSVTFAILQRNALANVVLSLYKAFQGDGYLTVCRMTKTIEEYIRHESLPLDPLVRDYLLEWLSPETTEKADSGNGVKDNEVVRLLIQKTREISPREKGEKWKRFDALRQGIAHNSSFSKAEEKAERDELIRYLDFLVGTEHAFRYLFGFSTDFAHPKRTVEDFRKMVAYSELVAIIEGFLGRTCLRVNETL